MTTAFPCFLARAASLGLTALAVLPEEAPAQSWATPETCTIETAEIAPEAIDAALMVELEAEAARIPNATGRLWRITSPDGAVSHLWATFHSTERLILDLPPILRRILEDASFVAVEYDPVFASREQHDAFMQGGNLFVDEGTNNLYATIDERVRDWIGARLDSLAFGAEVLPHFSPGGLAATVLTDPCDDFAASVYPGQDSFIQLLGRQAGARIVGLEHPEAFVETMNQPDRLATALAIIEGYGAYLNPEGRNTERQAGLALYLQGRIGLLIAWDRHYMAEFFGAEKAAQLLNLIDGYLVRERNRGFVQAARPLLDEGGGVIAVGAFHLPGYEGLVSRFRAAGYRVERVELPGEAPGG